MNKLHELVEYATNLVDKLGLVSTQRTTEAFNVVRYRLEDM